MSEANFPSGQWVGFYVYSNRTRRYLMDLMLEFQNGIISGEGADGLGMFGIDGRYYPKEGECSWVKTYFGRHSVDYTGYREQKGIWGTWTLPGTKGGFHIWPIGDGVPLDELKTQVEEEFPLKVAPQRPLQPMKASTRISQSPVDHFSLKYPRGQTIKTLYIPPPAPFSIEVRRWSLWVEEEGAVVVESVASDQSN